MKETAVLVTWRSKDYYLIDFGIYESLEDYINGEYSYALIDEDGAIMRKHDVVGNVMELGIKEIMECPEMSEAGYKRVLEDVLKDGV